MKDRIPTKPNRYAVYDDSHNFVRYEYHERADEPTQVGDALNKANLLSDAVATALGLTGNPQVKDALEKLKAFVDGTTTLANTKAQAVSGSYTGTGTYGSGNKNSLTFPFVPKFLYVSATLSSGLVESSLFSRQGRYSFLLNYGAAIENTAGTKTFNAMYLADGPYLYWSSPQYTLSNENLTLSWYGENASKQLNDSDIKFNYVAIG